MCFNRVMVSVRICMEGVFQSGDGGCAGVHRGDAFPTLSLQRAGLFEEVVWCVLILKCFSVVKRSDTVKLGKANCSEYVW